MSRTGRSISAFSTPASRRAKPASAASAGSSSSPCKKTSPGSRKTSAPWPASSRFCAGLGSAEALQTAAFDNLKRHLLPAALPPALTERGFRTALEQVQSRLPGLAAQLIARLEPILKLRQEILRRRQTAPSPAPPRTLTNLKQLGGARECSLLPGGEGWGEGEPLPDQSINP